MQDIERTAPRWLGAFRTYLGCIAAGNLAWETLHLPLYTIWKTGSTSEQLFAVVHCTLGDLLIALSALTAALLLSGNEGWPARGFWQVAALALVFGVAYTAFSEWLNVVIRASWAYSDLMPVISIGGLRLGLSPLMQWIAVPAVAFVLTRRRIAVVRRTG
jgi:hypothetical protein